LLLVQGRWTKRSFIQYGIVKVIAQDFVGVPARRESADRVRKRREDLHIELN
jgi:hypothetical protein